ncbi:DUF4328 domain-containing protein [Streptomyces sp. C36]|uniref:DUF4328 domain-containing protein n=1 Tax=Streptomyces sp. C36 TaxID=3237122 RepID=UPI0034C5F83A
MGPDGRCAACGAYQQPVAAPVTAAPAGYGYPPPPPAPMGLPVGGIDLRRGVRVAVMVLLGVCVLAALLHVAATGQQRSAVEDVISGGVMAMDREKINDADDFASSMTILQMLSMLATGVLWVIWFRRMRLNAEVFAPGTHRFSSGWAVGAWITPVVNLWFPKQMANDIYRASSPAGPQSAPKGLLNAWWTVWLASMVVGGIGTSLYQSANSEIRTNLGSDPGDALERLSTSLAVSGLSELLSAAAAVLALLVVRQLSGMQEQRAMGGMPPGMPYGAPAPAQGWAPAMPPAMPPMQPGGPVPPPYGAPYGPPPSAPPPQNPFGSGPAGY